MKINELAAIVARIFAIYLFLYTLRQFSSLAGYVGGASTSSLGPVVSYFYFVVAVFVPLMIAILIWKFPLTIANAVLPNLQSKEIKVSDGNTFLSSALIVLGVYVLTYAVPDFLYHITRFYLGYRIEDTGVDFKHSDDSVALFIVTIVAMAIGLWLILGVSGVNALIVRLRGSSL